MTAIPTPFFLDGSRGRLFAVHHAPPQAASGNVLCVPAFNEEMNRCRSMLTLQAQALARVGVGTLVVDLFGTGESDGVYGDGRWDGWLDDIGTAIDWLDRQPGGCIGLLGVRLGVPLAAQALRDRPLPGRALIAWQPVVDGKSYFTQFLRMRIAANMDRTDIPKETTSGMREQLAAGNPVEVAGYEIHPELAAAIDRVRLADLAPPEGSPVGWFEKVAGPDNEIPAPSRTLLEQWQSPSRRLAVRGFDGPAFWALHDRVTAPSLLALTTEWIDSLRTPA